MSDDSTELDDLPLPEAEGMGLFGDAPPEPVAASAPSAVTSGKPESGGEAGYRVLARKYRPTKLPQLIGQDALVRTLQNAFATGRVAHAFMLTGVRGVGKTTTARIIARGLNCTGVDGKGGPTADPCGVCPNCVAILNDRHPDVLEMDAASRTGVDDVREIIEACHFRPIQGRMKVFIVDEVHMLSRNAFNALLKTLEEPPSQVTFIFATTELRKVPVTVLSRCQRFDLRRVAQSELVTFFSGIAAKEDVVVEPDALKLIARAADGSVRDGLSLLDQAIAQGGETEAGSGRTVVPTALVANMLGLSDRSLVFDLFEAVMKGDITRAVALSDSVYDRGGDLGMLLRDLAELAHTVTRLKTVKSLQDALDMPEAERTRGAMFAESLPLSTLSRLWQMLLKGISEVDDAPLRREAAEMVLVRLCYASTMPSPADLLKQLESGAVPAVASAPSGADAAPGQMPSHSAPSREPRGTGGTGGGMRRVANGAWQEEGDPGPGGEPMASEEARGGHVVAMAEVVPLPRAEPGSWRELVAFVRDCREATLHGHLRYSTHLVSFASRHVEVRLDGGAPRDLPKRLQELLRARLGTDWTIRPVEAEGEPTLAEQSAEIIQLNRRRSENHPLVQAILTAFPGAELGEVKDHSFDDHYGLPMEDRTIELGLDPEAGDPEDGGSDPYQD